MRALTLTTFTYSDIQRSLFMAPLAYALVTVIKLQRRGNMGNRQPTSLSPSAVVFLILLTCLQALPLMSVLAHEYERSPQELN